MTMIIWKALFFGWALWGLFVMAKKGLFSPARWRGRRMDLRWWCFVAAIVLFVAASGTSGVALSIGCFVPWMLAPLAASFLLMMPLRCYFECVTRTRARHTARNVVFASFAAVLFALACQLLPLSSIGIGG